MKYSEIRSDIKTGDVFFTAEKALFSRLIRFFTKSTVSHVGMFVILEERVFCVESMEGFGVRTIPASELLGKKKFIFGKIESKFSEKEIHERAFGNKKGLPKIGSKYDMIGALLSLFWDTKSNAVFCSEYVKKILDLDFPASINGILPKDILNKCDSYYEIND